MKNVFGAFVMLAVATPASACGEKNPTCTLEDTTVIHDGMTFCLGKDETKAERDDVRIEDYGHRIFGVTKDGATKFYTSYTIARCLDAPLYLKEVAAN